MNGGETATVVEDKDHPRSPDSGADHEMEVIMHLPSSGGGSANSTSHVEPADVAPEDTPTAQQPRDDHEGTTVRNSGVLEGAHETLAGVQQQPLHGRESAPNTVGERVAPEEDLERQQRYASPYNYPPEAHVVQSSGAEIVLGIPVTSGESDSDELPPITYLPPSSQRRHAASATFVMADDGTIMLANPAALAHVEACLDREASLLLACFEMSTSVRHCAVAELVACALFAVIMVWFLVLLPLPVILFAATRRYYAPATIVGSLFFPAAVGMRIFAAYLVSMWSEPARTIVILLVVFMGLADIYVGVGAVRFIHRLNHTPDDLVMRLKDGWIPGPEELERAQRYRAQLDDPTRPPQGMGGAYQDQDLGPEPNTV